MLKLKARVYLWAEGTDLRDLDLEEDLGSGPIKVLAFSLIG
jgi:hypothetical protein